MIVNGPYAKKIGIHGGNGCFAGIPRERVDRPRDPPDAAESRRRHSGRRFGDGVFDAAALHRLPHENTERSPWKRSRWRAATPTTKT